jgi:4'-phosphopantetheinyl transferase
MPITIPIWQPAPPTPRLRAGEVHVWRGRLDGGCEAHAGFPPILSEEETVRAARFHFARDRRRYISSRTMVRSILGRYLACSPGAIRFTRGAHGKPALADGATSMRFNLSHSEDLLLLAVAEGREVGVDVESTDREVAFETLAEEYFAPEEARAVQSAPTSARGSKFYEIWTSTEARLKALGTGLGGELRAADHGRWSLHNFLPADGFAAALAVEGAEFQLEHWSWLN